VTAQFCAGCGAPLTPDSQFCAYCGRPVATGAPSAPAPLPTAGPTPPPVPPYPSMEPARSPGPRRWLVIVIVLVVIIAIVGGLLYYEATAPNVDVNVFVFYAPDNVCGYNNATAIDNAGYGPWPVEYQGFNDSPSVTDSFEFTIQNFNTSSSCNVVSVATNTSGFSLSDVTYTGVIGPYPDEGNLSLDLTLPGSSWTGNVNLVIG
jgi:zinc-ribbon domain